ncbi:cubilin-like isoform X2 [Anneissia japonica]|uniref:cubilin-like isoform X2 n=1 Tax=Anneissia japonica TaxID=1529436 RepID=UPI001425AB7E|nr:cubilin-like isoform X2 [Anneissia japonica]
MGNRNAIAVCILSFVFLLEVFAETTRLHVDRRQNEGVVIIPPNCDRVLESETGCITSPNWPRKSVDFNECKMEVKLQVDKRILLTFNNFTLEGTDVCDENNYVLVSNGKSSRQDVYCGTFHPFTWLTDSNEVWVTMNALTSKVFNRYNATYRTVDKAPKNACSRVLVEEIGVYSSSDMSDFPYESSHFGNTIPNGDTCEVVIHARPDERVSISFRQLAIPNCQNPLKIKDLLTDRTKNICGEHESVSFTSDANEVVITYDKTDLRNVVEFDYEFITRPLDESCSKLVLGLPENGLVVTTPNFPHPYPSNLECQYIFHTSFDKVISLNVSEFILQPPKKTHHGEICLDDYIQIRDLSTNQISQLCGSYHNFSWTSHSNEVLLTIKTDNLLDYTGIKLVAKSIIRLPDPDCMTITRHGDSFVLTSLKFPSNYPSGASCTLLFQELPDKYVIFDFEKFDLEDTQGCEGDYVQFISSTSGSLSDKLCGKKEPFTLTSDSNEVSIEFKTDARNQKSGFKAICSIINRPTRTPENTECSTNLHQKSGRIQLPVNPDWPPVRGSDCLIVIHADPDERIRLKFVSFVVSDQDSDKDFVEIHDISLKGETNKATYTGHLNPFSWTSIRNELAIYVRDEHEISSVSFIADYETLPRSEDGCEKLFTKRSGTIEWPFNGESKASHCDVLIRSDPNEQILFTFHKFTMEKGLCPEHSMTIQDVSTQRQDKFCSTTWLFSWLSESNEVSIDFRRNPKVFAEVSATYRFIPRPKLSAFNQFLTSPEGIISSLEHNRDEIIGKNCTVYIQTTPEHSVVVSLTDFLIGEKQDKNRQSITCTGEKFLEVKDLTTGRTNVYCGEFDLFTWTSDQNLVAITFHISIYPTYNVFRSTYKSIPRIAGCDHRVIKPTGTITSSNFPLPYSANSECRHIVHSEPGNLVTLNFTNFDVQPCGNDYVELIDMGSGRVETLCGSYPLFSWTSDTNEVSIRLHGRQKSIGASGFRTTYQHVQRPLVSECYVRLNDSQNTQFTLPKFVVKDAEHVECQFYIKTKPSERIQLTVEDIDEVFNCSDSGLEVTDVATTRTNKYCAISHSFSWTADTNELKLRVFASKDQLPQLLAKWKPIVRVGILGVWDAESAEVVLDGTDTYQLIIRTLPNYRLVVNYLHEHADNHDCDAERITITDSTTLRTYTDCDFFNGIMSWVSDGNEATIDIKQDDHTSKIHYISVLKAPPSECNKVLVTNSNLDVNSNLETSHYPDMYDNNDDCDMVIQTRSDSRIQIVFEKFWLEQENSMGCHNDFLNMTDTSVGFQYDHSERICNRHEPFSWTSEGNSLLLRFHTDSSIAHTGYLAKYNILERPIPSTHCNQTYLGANGLIQSPNVAERLPQYQNNQLCLYFLKGKVGEKIVIDFKFFDVELQTPCERDYLKIEDIATGKTNIICGQHENLIWESESNEVNITFVTDGSRVFNGFDASYKMENLTRTSYCDVTLLETTGTFNSPSYPAKYANDLDCTYTIIADPHHTIEVKFEYFDVEASPHCTNDYVELSSSGEGTSQHFCDRKGVFKWNSTTNRAVIRLHTDHIVTKTGFLATYKTRLILNDVAQCSEDLKGPYGMFETPDYPSSYGNNLDCSYSITVNPLKVVRVDFLDFELEEPRFNYCSDFVKLPYNSNDEVTLCGQLDQHVYVLNDHKVVVHFHSDGSNTYRGFKAYYTEIDPPPESPSIVTPTQPPFCNLEAGKLTEHYGVIHSPNFPLYYPDNELCRTNIETKKNTHIVITIRFMDIENYQLCEWDSLQIFDEVSGRSSEKLCGSLDAPFIWESDSNRVKLVFRSDDILARTGYYGTYQAIENSETPPVGIDKNKPEKVPEKPPHKPPHKPPQKPPPKLSDQELDNNNLGDTHLGNGGYYEGPFGGFGGFGGR